MICFIFLRIRNKNGRERIVFIENYSDFIEIEEKT